ncbi:hypothetical protein [Paraburkholderia diazotrophica]|uniref:Uncharacterized protein n=1 Tax=Paraburkholderia diazotrophica TaxID=667676 RepID=A0A1H7DWB6_9BURK|nr:hypothetical protein [Paraburkholderia diazotrophica]SEK06033.1 hypothetical protein SAMN05192539_103623 [Paraburkholderia diazotrophica]
MDPYENIVIGNFLYSLGLTVGQLSGKDVRPMCINLLQQSPMDRPLGDVLVENAGITRLIEFKREQNESVKEETKRLKLSRALQGDSRMQSVSREIHWYIETSESVANLVSRVVPYLDFADDDATTTTLERFTESSGRDAVMRAIDDETHAAYKQYLKLVAYSHGELQGASGGLVVSYSKDEGIRYVLLSDVRDLLFDHRLVREAYFERVRRYAKELNHNRALKHRGLSKTLELGRDGPSLSL